MKRFLIIQTAFIGDVVLATPMISELHRIYPESQIDILVKKGNESLLKNNPGLHQVYTLNKSTGKWKEIRRLQRVFKKENYDYVFNLHRFASSGVLTWLSGAKRKYGFQKNPLSFFYHKKFEHAIGDGTHEVERNLTLIKELGALPTARPTLYPSIADLEKVKEFKSMSYITIAPSSVWYTKQLPPIKWKELIEKQSHDTAIYLLGGTTDSNACDEIISASKHPAVFNLAGSLSYLESAALMKDAKMNHVNDSGPMHFASAVNANVTAYYCSTIPDFGFGPLSDNSRIKEVSDLECRPCGLHGHNECPKGHFDCGFKMDMES